MTSILNVPTDAEIEAMRMWLRARARFLVGGLKGRSKTDPVYAHGSEAEHHVPREHYSSCGDLPQCLAFESGVRLPFVNRTEYEGWRPGRNLLDFYDGTSKGRHAALKTWNAENGTPAAPSNDVPGAGAFCFVWSDEGKDAHALVTGYVLEDGTIETFNYGSSGMSEAEFPGGKQVNAKLRERWAVVLKSGAVSNVLYPYGQDRPLGPNEKSQRKLAGLWIGSRRLRFVLDVPRLLELCDPDLLPLQGGGAGEVIDAIDEETDLYEAM